MTFVEAIKEGFRLVNRNWQLVLIQIGMVFISAIGAFIIVGLPLAIAFIIFGIDLTGLTDVRDLMATLRGPSEILSRYLGLVLIILTSILLYVLLVALLGIYIFGGSIGIIGRSLSERSMKFQMSTFFGEAKRLFLRLLGFTSVIGVISIVAFFSLGILGGGIAALVSFAQTQDSTLALFFGTFFSLILFVIALFVILGILSVALYGMAALFFKDTGPTGSVREALSSQKPQCILALRRTLPRISGRFLCPDPSELSLYVDTRHRYDSVLPLSTDLLYYPDLFRPHDHSGYIRVLLFDGVSGGVFRADRTTGRRDRF